MSTAKKNCPQAGFEVCTINFACESQWAPWKVLIEIVGVDWYKKYWGFFIVMYGPRNKISRISRMKLKIKFSITLLRQDLRAGKKMSSWDASNGSEHYITLTCVQATVTLSRKMTGKVVHVKVVSCKLDGIARWGASVTLHDVHEICSMFWLRQLLKVVLQLPLQARTQGGFPGCPETPLSAQVFGINLCTKGNSRLDETPTSLTAKRFWL